MDRTTRGGCDRAWDWECDRYGRDTTEEAARAQQYKNVKADDVTTQRLHPDPSTRLPASLRRPLRPEAFPQGTVPHHRASHQLPHDERPQQRKEAHGCPHCRPRFRDRTSMTRQIFESRKWHAMPPRIWLTIVDPHHDRPEPHPGRRRCHRQLRSP